MAPLPQAISRPTGSDKAADSGAGRPAEFRYRLRGGNKTFYNAYGPALGLELRKWSFHLGMDYYWQRFPELDESSNRLRYYLSWYYDWDLKR